MDEKQFLKPHEFRKVLGIHRNTVINWIKSGKIKSKNINGRYYIHIDEVERLKSEGVN
jgi:predicted site-specific integrase-resolvase